MFIPFAGPFLPVSGHVGTPASYAGLLPPSLARRLLGLRDAGRMTKSRFRSAEPGPPPGWLPRARPAREGSVSGSPGDLVSNACYLDIRCARLPTALWTVPENLKDGINGYKVQGWKRFEREPRRYLVLEGPLKRSFINRGSIDASTPRKVFHLPRMPFSRDGKRQI